MKTIKFKINLIEKARLRLKKNLDGVRAVKNLYIIRREEEFKKSKTVLSVDSFVEELIKLKETDKWEWLKKCYEPSLLHGLSEVDDEYNAFYAGLESGEKVEKPKIVGKNPDSEAVTVDELIVHSDKHASFIELPIVNFVKIENNSDLPEERLIISGKLIREKDEYYLSILYHDNDKHLAYKHEAIRIKLLYEEPDNYIKMNYTGGEVKIIPSFTIDHVYMKQCEREKKFNAIKSNKISINYKHLIEDYVNANPSKSISAETRKQLLSKASNTGKIAEVDRKLEECGTKMHKHRLTFINKLITDIVKDSKPKRVIIEKPNKISKITSKYTGEKRYNLFIDLLEKKCNEYKVEFIQVYID